MDFTPRPSPLTPQPSLQVSSLNPELTPQASFTSPLTLFSQGHLVRLPDLGSTSSTPHQHPISNREPTLNPTTISGTPRPAPGFEPQEIAYLPPPLPHPKGCGGGGFSYVRVWNVDPDATKAPSTAPFRVGQRGRKYTTHRNDPDATKAPSTAPFRVGQRGRKVGYLLGPCFVKPKPL